jgi:hypothetical protein
MPETREHLAKYRDEFAKRLGEIDDLASVVLKGHLLLEVVLDNIISVIFFHAEHVHDGRFRFAQKVRIARAHCLRKDRLLTWNHILAVNALRNEVAHSFEGERRGEKLERLRQSLLADAAPEVAEELRDLPAVDLVLYACAICVGFLGKYEHDLRALRRYVDALDATPDPGGRDR